MEAESERSRVEREKVRFHLPTHARVRPTTLGLRLRYIRPGKSFSRWWLEETSPTCRTPYDGTGSLETFLAKFEQMAVYLKWNEIDRFHHLCASLEGAAGQVLWGLKGDASAATVTALLRTRFGNEMQVERFRAELQARKRKHNETLQSLYLDITRMVSLAHPTSVLLFLTWRSM